MDVSSDFVLELILSLSAVLQFAAAVIAIRLIWTTGNFIAWILLACGFVLQGVRRLISLYYVLNGQMQEDITVAGLGLAISLFMLLGILKFRPLFEEIALTHQALIDKHKQLEKANLELEGFASMVSHDLRTPLGIVCGYAEHLRESQGHKLDAQALRCLEEIEKQGFRMAALVEDLLTLAWAGFIASPSEPVDANRVCDEVLCDLAGQIAGRKANITRGELPAVSVPESLLMEVFKNLIINALNYACAEGDTIEVGGERRENLLRLYVRDHGPGIPAGEKARIFECFYRGATGNSSKGTGVGLAIVQKIAQLYGGSVWVEDTPGGGSTFLVEIKEPTG